jgi:predicted transposase/invertase (TIGR01784 family)
MYETDMYSDMATAELRGELRGELKGELRGELKGELKANRKNAQAMKNEGIDVNTIARITGLTVDDVLKL